MLVVISGGRGKEVLTTTSRIVAECFEKQHKHVLRDIDELKKDVPNFGLMFYEIQEPDSYGRLQRVYQMNRDGFSLLAMGFTGDKAMAWKLKYITAFNEMEAELKRIYAERNQWEIERAKGVMIRHILTDTIKLKIADSSNKRFAHPNYTKLIYKTLFGKSFKELQQEYGIKPKESLRDYLTSEQLKEVESMEMLVSSLINVGMGYDEIKDFITERCTKQLSA